MAKQQTFADKLKKSSRAVDCPECGEALQPTLLLKPVRSDRGTLRIREVRVTVCKCNRKEIYG